MGQNIGKARTREEGDGKKGTLVHSHRPYSLWFSSTQAPRLLDTTAAYPDCCFLRRFRLSSMSGRYIHSCAKEPYLFERLGMKTSGSIPLETRGSMRSIVYGYVSMLVETVTTRRKKG